MGVFKQLDTTLQELIAKYGRDAVAMACATLTACTCKRCGYDWKPRTEGAPTMCPRCKSTLWQIERGAQ